MLVAITTDVTGECDSVYFNAKQALNRAYHQSNAPKLYVGIFCLVES